MIAAGTCLAATKGWDIHRFACSSLPMRLRQVQYFHKIFQVFDLPAQDLIAYLLAQSTSKDNESLCG